VRMKQINLALESILLPPPPGTCRECAVDHDPRLPHDQTSLYWQYSFYHKSNGRWPTWDDAMVHCTEDVKVAWRQCMKEVVNEEGGLK
jgi:hypothetical protein